MPQAKAARSLPSPEADIDDLDCASVDPKPLTRKRARGRPPGVGIKVTKPASKSTRGGSKRAVAAVSASVRHLLAEQGPGDHLAVPSGSERKSLYHGNTGTRAGDGRAEVCSAQRGLVRPRPAESPNKLKAGGSAGPERTSKPAGYSTIVEIPETQGIDILRSDGSEDAPVVFDELLTADPGAGPEVASAGNGVNDVSVRRRLGDLTKRYQNLEMRHRDLREVGVKAAERNFESLRKQAEENAASKRWLLFEMFTAGGH